MKKKSKNKKKSGYTSHLSCIRKITFHYLGCNKLSLLVISIFVILMLSVIDWGVPSPTHPFPYHMDEWHQLQAVKSVFKYGTPNVEGAASGTLFHFLLSGIYLIPFMFLKIIQPFAIKSAVDSLELQQRLFEVLRLNTLIFGVLSVFFIGRIAKKFLNIPNYIPVFLFVFTPIFLSLSNYFKYDIALIFWILFSFYFIFMYAEKQRAFLFYAAGFISALTLATKISALPMALLFPVSYFFFTKNCRKKIRVFVIGLLIFCLTFLLLGIPDLLLGKGSLLTDFFYNILVLPSKTDNIYLPKPYWEFMGMILFPTLFGKVLSILFAISFCYLVIKLITRKKIDNISITNRNVLFILFSFLIFLLSIIPLRYYAGSNRILVLLPFIVLLSGYVLEKIRKQLQRIGLFIIIFGFLFQFGESMSWISLKLLEGPEKKMSFWIVENVKKGSVIGIENIPLYQAYPDLILKEFYFHQYKKDYQTIYKYEIINATSKNLPEYILLSNDISSLKYLKSSDKNTLAKRLLKNGYKRQVVFTPDYTLYKYFGTPMNYYFSTIVASATELSFYKKSSSSSFMNDTL